MPSTVWSRDDQKFERPFCQKAFLQNWWDGWLESRRFTRNCPEIVQRLSPQRTLETSWRLSENLRISTGGNPIIWPRQIFRWSPAVFGGSTGCHRWAFGKSPMGLWRVSCKFLRVLWWLSGRSSLCLRAYSGQSPWIPLRTPANSLCNTLTHFPSNDHSTKPYVSICLINILHVDENLNNQKYSKIN